MIWKEINSVYMVSTDGRVVSKARGIERILKPRMSNSGYQYVDFGRDGGRFYVHRLVAEAFIPNNEDKRTVNHKNGIKTDNRIENLEWATYSENHKHAYRTGLKTKQGIHASKARLDELQVLTIRACYPKVRLFELARYFKMDPASIQSITSGRNWKHLL